MPDALANPSVEDDTQQIPNEYKLMIQNAASENLFVFAEREQDAPGASSGSGSNTPSAEASASTSTESKSKKRPRACLISTRHACAACRGLLILNDGRHAGEPTLMANVVHECNLTPDVTSPAYSAIMRRRNHVATQPKRA